MTFLMAWLQQAAWNGMVLGIPLCLAGRWVRNPGIRHAFFFTALAVFLIPPLWRPFDYLPEGPSAPSTSSLAVGHPAGGPGIPEFHPGDAFDLDMRLPDWELAPQLTMLGNESDLPANLLFWGMACWLTVSAVLALLAIYRVAAMEFLLCKLCQARGGDAEEIFQVAKEAGLPMPMALMHQGKMPPMVWALPFRLVLMLPAELWQTLGAEKKKSILLHEFAHILRGDYRVRWLELVLTTLFWWHPVLHWARFSLRQAEEELCDSFVLERLPDNNAQFAHALLDVVDFLSDSPAAAPGLASGIGSGNNLKRRLDMILGTSRWRKASRWAAASLLGGGLLFGSMSFLPKVAGQDEKRDQNREQKDRPKDAPRGERQKEGDRPKDAPRGDWPKDGGRGERPKEGDRPKDAPRGDRPDAPRGERPNNPRGNPEQIEQARKEFEEARKIAEKAMERAHQAQRKLAELGGGPGEPRRVEGRGPGGEPGGPPMMEMMRALQEMRAQLEQMRKELNQLRGNRGEGDNIRRERPDNPPPPPGGAGRRPGGDNPPPPRPDGARTRPGGDNPTPPPATERRPNRPDGEN